MKLGAHHASLDVSSLHPLCEHVLLKMLLNAFSMLVMGRLGRYESNLMTWVRPSNYKLIDRAIRCIAFLLARDSVGPVPSYEDIAYRCFAEMQRLAPNESIVLETWQPCAHRPIHQDSHDERDGWTSSSSSSPVSTTTTQSQPRPSLGLSILEIDPGQGALGSVHRGLARGAPSGSALQNFSGPLGGDIQNVAQLGAPCSTTGSRG